jgi:hypothetical protein
MSTLGRPAARAPINTGDIPDGIITSAKVAADVLTAADIAPNAVTASELADDAVDTAAIAANAVTTAKITNLNVTAAKVASDVATTAGTQTLTNKTLTTPAGIVKGDVGLGNVDNTSDSTLQTAVLGAAAKSDVGLGNVTNESKATMFTSPTFTGNAVLGTPASGTMTNVTGIPLAGLSATGTASATTYLRGDNSWQTAGSTSASDLSSGTLAIARLGTGGTKMLWRQNNGYTGVTHSTSWVYMINQILGTVPTTSNYLLLEVNVRYRVEYNCSGIGIQIHLDNSGSAPSSYNSANIINIGNFSSLDDASSAHQYLMANINPDGPAFTAWVHHYHVAFMFDGSSQFHASTNYVYLSGINQTGGGSYTRSDCTLNSVTMWEIQK